MTPTPPREASFEEDLTLVHDSACQCSAIVVCRKCKETREIIRAAHARELDAARDATRIQRDREWSNRLQSQDTLHPDSPDLDIAIAWYVSVQRAAAAEKDGR